MKWEKTGRTVKANGESTTTYTGGRWKIESRKRAIEHSARGGYWMHTSYFLLFPDGREREFWRLQDAKKWAEDLDFFEGVNEHDTV